MSHNRIKDDVWTGCVNERGYWINNDQRTKADHLFFFINFTPLLLNHFSADLIMGMMEQYSTTSHFNSEIKHIQLI